MHVRSVHSSDTKPYSQFFVIRHGKRESKPDSHRQRQRKRLVHVIAKRISNFGRERDTKRDSKFSCERNAKPFANTGVVHAMWSLSGRNTLLHEQPVPFQRILFRWVMREHA